MYRFQSCLGSSLFVCTGNKKTILRSNDFDTCLSCYIAKREREREKVHVSDDHCYGQRVPHSIISLNKTRTRERIFVYFAVCQRRQRIMIVLWRWYIGTLTVLLLLRLLLLRLPPVNIGLVAHKRNAQKETQRKREKISHWMKKHREIRNRSYCTVVTFFDRDIVSR